MLKNQNGSVMIATLIILVLLTIIGISSVRTSNTEVKITTNMLLHQIAFYAAESGISVAPLWVRNDENYPESEWSNVDFTTSSEGTLGNGAEYNYEVSPKTELDDGVEKVIRYGDEDGDHLYELNYTTGPPLLEVISDGTHVRGSIATIEASYIFQPAFELPNTALWVENPDMVDFKGNATVSGDSSDLDICPDVPDVLHHLNPVNPMDEPAHFGAEFVHESSGGMYPFSLVKANLSERADYIGDTFPTEIAEGSTTDDPVIIIINGDLEINNQDLKVPANGILYVDGNLRINGNVEWTGLIITTGNTSVGNGTADIIGSLVTGESAEVDISGTITIQHDCSGLNNLFDIFSGYRMTSWRQI
jgi:hypothetical protein